MLGKFGCPLCNGTGIVIGDFGIEQECECVRQLTEEMNVDSADIKITGADKVEPPNLFGELGVNDKILKMKLVPEHRINDSFEENHVKIVAVQMCGVLKCNINADKLKKYLSVLNKILTDLRARKLPDRSYIIGASNGFGKTTFVNTAIKIMASNGMHAVPYISLTELAEKWADATELLAKRLENKGTALRRVAGAEELDDDTAKDEYDWHDYVKADLVFVYLTSTNEETMWVETQVLKHLLDLRGAKGKATIVMTKESLEWYKNSDRVRKYMLMSIIEAQANDGSREKAEFGRNEMAYELREKRYDKLEHVSTYLVPLKE